MFKTILLPALFVLVASTCNCSAYQSSGESPFRSGETVSEPIVFGEGVISTGDYELNAMFTADGNTVYFTRTTPDPRFTMMTILVSDFEDGHWQKPTVASFSGQFSEVDPFISPDGQSIFYTSTRPRQGVEPTEDYNIWKVDRTSSGWSTPIRLPETVNTDGDEYYPGVSANGNLYFSAVREGGVGRYDLYVSEFADGDYLDPKNLGEAVNSEGSEIDLYVAPDESYLIFVSYRDGGQGRGDLYISYNRNGTWTPAVNLGDLVNTPGREYTPVISPEGNYLFFTSDRSTFGGSMVSPMDYDELQARLDSPGNGLGDIYYVSVSALGLDL